MYAIKATLNAEMGGFGALMKADPDRGRELFRLGEEIVALAVNGSYRRFCETAGRAVHDEGFPAAYFLSKAFTAAFLNHHLLIAAHLLDHGFPANNPCCPNVLMECLRKLDDEECYEIVDFLSKRQFDFNRQEDATWLAPLHLAVQAYMPRTVAALLEHDADVNAVAEGDRMPMTMARALAEGVAKEEILAMLAARGARDTWRRAAAQEDSSFQSSTSISTKPGQAEAKFVKFSSASAVLVAQQEDGGQLFSTGNTM